MAKQTINIGTSANSGTGDPLRTAFTKANDNFTELYTAVDGIPSAVSELTNDSGFLTIDTVPDIPQDIADLTDNSNLLGTQYDQSLNTTDNVAFNTITFPDDTVQTTAYTMANDPGFATMIGDPNNVDNVFWFLTTSAAENGEGYYGGRTNQSTGDQYPLVIKTDANGNILWSQIFAYLNGTITTMYLTGSDLRVNLYYDIGDSSGSRAVQFGLDKDTGNVIDSSGSEIAILNRYISISDSLPLGGTDQVVQVGWITNGFTDPQAVIFAEGTTPANTTFTIPKSSVTFAMNDSDSYYVIGTGISPDADNSVYVDSVVEDGDNWVITVGGLSTDFTVEGGSWSIVKSLSEDAVITTTDSNGDVIIRTLGTAERTLFDGFNALVNTYDAETGDNTIFAAGWASVDGNEQKPSLAKYVFNSNTKELTFQWSKTLPYIPSVWNAASDIIKLANGNLVILTSNNDDDPFVTCVDTDGTLIWSKQIAVNDPASMYWGGLVALQNGDFIVEMDGNSIISRETDAYIYRFDADGNVVWQRSLGVSNDTYIQFFSFGSKVIDADSTHFYTTQTGSAVDSPTVAYAIKLPINGSSSGAFGNVESPYTDFVYEATYWTITDAIDPSVEVLNWTELTAEATTANNLFTPEYQPITVQRYTMTPGSLSLGAFIENNGHVVEVTTEGFVSLPNSAVIETYSNAALMIGYGGNDNHGDNSIAIGNDDVGFDQLAGSIAIGYQAGWADVGPLGLNSIAIGTKAAYTSAPDNSITLNATGEILNPSSEGLFVAPIRADVEDINDAALFYDNSTAEISTKRVITLAVLQNLVSASTDFADFQSRIAAL